VLKRVFSKSIVITATKSHAQKSLAEMVMLREVSNIMENIPQ
jgi:hypothetical protein